MRFLEFTDQNFLIQVAKMMMRGDILLNLILTNKE